MASSKKIFISMLKRLEELTSFLVLLDAFKVKVIGSNIYVLAIDHAFKGMSFSDRDQIVKMYLWKTDSRAEDFLCMNGKHYEWKCLPEIHKLWTFTKEEWEKSSECKKIFPDPSKDGCDISRIRRGKGLKVTSHARIRRVVPNRFSNIDLECDI